MIEMSVDKETVLSCEGKTDPPSHQPSELSGNDTSVLHSPEKSTHTHLGKEDGKEAGSEASRAERMAANRAVSESCLLEAEFSTQTQNGTPQSKQQTQRLSKRRTTLSGGFKYPGYGKRRRRANSESSSVLPTNFLLGGNIFDPLNLNSLLDEEVNRALNAETPKSSPLPAKNRDPVEILIPRDITDPLNLNCPSTRDRSLLVSPLKSGGRRRHRNKHHGAGGGGRGLGESMVSQSDFSETNGRSAAQADGATSLSMPHESGTVVDSLDTETLKDDRTLLSSTSEAQTSDQPNLTTNGDDVQDKRGSVPPTNDASAAPPPSLNPAHPSSNRQRKRKRASSRMDSDCSFGEGNSGSKSGRYSQTFHATGMGSASGSADRPNPNHCRSQYNNNQQQQRKKFQYGNYNKYYGYRNPGLSEDPRIRVFKPEWFQGKAVLDLGCNTGHLTLSIAKNWRPARIAGLDIDGSLIHAARQNIRHYLSEVHTQQARRSGENGEREEEKDVAKDKSKRKENNGEKCAAKDEHLDMQVKEKKRSGAENESTDDDRGGESGKMEDGECVGLPDEKNSFPVSLRISRGPIAAPPLPEMSAKSLPPGDFPANITFVKGNYVLESDSLLLTQREEYDVILCLSVTKWVHLNWGDAGLKRLFHRVYRHLRPGGLFILEPQPWNSYSKRKKLTEDICKNYHGIRLRPDQFSSFLTTEVGFTSYELIGMPQNLSRGFQRPIYLFHKGPSFQK